MEGTIMTDKPRILAATRQSVIQGDDHPLILDAADHPLILRGINRRLFLKAGAATSALLAWPFRAWPFAQSPLTISKFTVTLPGLGTVTDTHNANNVIQADGVGNYIPVISGTTNGPMIGGKPSTVYAVLARAFHQQVHPNIPTTRFWGYHQNGIATSHQRYLGGLIVAESGIPVQLRMFNNLPAAHILPVDISLVADLPETGTRQDRIAVHLHGGFVFWQFDGGPFAWFANPVNGGLASGSSFSNPGNGYKPGVGLPAGHAIYDYPNETSARLIWYHDHAFGLTRTNVYAGLASGYLITDTRSDGEAGLIARETVPGKRFASALDGALGIPLIIQDKTFWDGPSGRDPRYPAAVPGGAVIGSLWYPHVYEGAADTDMPDMGLPPHSPPIAAAPTARWTLTGTPPDISSVPEYFSDTMLVNGAPYPTAAVNPQRYRFRFLNGSQARFYNLQLFVADGTADGITLAPTGESDNNGNPILAPTNPPGPAFIQIGNECGLLEKPAVFSTNAATNRNSNRPMGYKLTSTVGLAAAATHHHPRADAGRFRTMPPIVRVGPASADPTIGNADRWNLLMAPAERPDVIIDFRGFEGKQLILYNDSPAPFPGGDIRNDYYVSDQFAFDLTVIGGAPKTKPGFGPDTRVLMKFDVASGPVSDEIPFAEAVTRLNTELPAAFAATQPPDPGTPPVTRILTLLEDNEPETTFGRLRQVLGAADGVAVPLVAEPTEQVMAGSLERWVIVNTTADTHPMHFHLVNVKVRSRQQADFDANGVILPTTGVGIGPVSGPEPGEVGWKETVRMNPAEITTVDMKFDLPPGTPIDSPRLFDSFGLHASEYVWHCHILEHEEHDMMHPIAVINPTLTATKKK
jgi:spore coat protein A